MSLKLQFRLFFSMSERILLDLLAFLFHFHCFVTSLPNDEILDWSQLKAFADNKINLIEKLRYVLGWLENIVGKMAFSPFHTMISKYFFFKAVKSWDSVGKD